MGQKVDELSSTNQGFLLQRDQWPAGVYVFRILAGGQVQTTGKFIVR